MKDVARLWVNALEQRFEYVDRGEGYYLFIDHDNIPYVTAEMTEVEKHFALGHKLREYTSPKFTNTMYINTTERGRA